MKKFKIYDEIVSLGYNCEISMRLNDLFDGEKQNHFLYTWTYQHDRTKFINSLSTMDKIHTGNFNLLSWGMLRSEKYDISFHTTMPKEELFNPDGTANNNNVKTAIAELRSRIKYLTKKLQDLFMSDKKTLFILKIKFNGIENDKKYIKEVYQILHQKYISKKFALLVVVEENDYKGSLLENLRTLEDNKLKIKTVKFFANDGQTDTDGDIPGWIKLLDRTLSNNLTQNTQIAL